MAEADRPDFESFRIAGIERLRVISLISKDSGFPGSWGVPIKSIRCSALKHSQPGPSTSCASSRVVLKSLWISVTGKKMFPY
jgi:hypothetical protein